MPNLEDVIGNPDALEQSVRRMMEDRGGRGEVRMNHGIRNAQELEELVLQPSSASEDIEAFRHLLGLEVTAND